ncbi:MAG TPA: GIY-YIG nuclease family protein [Candidatus Udaeobacter sp.]|nr:GIY-YIG nuclease family protein [Candidatus Udaeobacter sp.]
MGSNPTSPTGIITAAKMFYCYVLRSRKTRRRYVGSCEDLTERIRRHNAGQSTATKDGVPWELGYSESFVTRAEAVQRERYYKTGRGRGELDQRSSSGRRGDKPWVQIPPAR